MSSRDFRIARLVPVYSEVLEKCRTTAQICELYYQEYNEQLQLRTLQRSMLAAQQTFGFECLVMGKVHYWRYPKNHPIQLFPAMDDSFALSLVMLDQLALGYLPDKVIENVQPLIAQAKARLAKRNMHAGRWSEKIALTSFESARKKPSINPEVRARGCPEFCVNGG